MSGNEKPLTRDALVSMQVIDAQGHLIGKVKDLAFSVGRNGISLTIENDVGETRHVPWEEVQAAADYILLKPSMQSSNQSSYQPAAAAQTTAQPATQSASSQPTCSTCGKPLTWIPQYQRWYCYNDKKYA
jgi:sporulation protein YlmC with PRC-barrel domain